MNLKSTLIFVALACLAIGGVTQSAPSASAKHSDEILAKSRKVDLLNQILPVLMTKAQIAKLLPVIEKSRQTVRETEKGEVTLLADLEPRLDKAIKDGIDKYLVPDRAIVNRAYAMFQMMNMKREAVIAENVDALMKVIDESWNAGQKKAAANALRPQDPRIDAAKMTEDQKLRYFVRVILLDPLAYDLLLKLREKAPS